jgi:deoxyadenosine/deoxycytidine kinase
MPVEAKDFNPESSSQHTKTPFLHVVIFGSVGVGKTKLMADLEELIATKNSRWSFRFYQEPIERWQRYGSQEDNMLELIYWKPKKHTFEFQLAAYATKKNQLHDMCGVSIVERSFACQSEVFIPLLYENGNLTPCQNQLLFDIIGPVAEKYEADLFIYLECSDEEAMRRIFRRNRRGEHLMPWGMLCNIRAKYERYLGTLDPRDVIRVNTEEELTATDMENLWEAIMVKLFSKL